MPPKKKPRKNISGLRNQHQPASRVSPTTQRVPDETDELDKARTLASSAQPQRSNKDLYDQETLKPDWNNDDDEEDIGGEDGPGDEVGMNREGLQVVRGGGETTSEASSFDDGAQGLGGGTSEPALSSLKTRQVPYVIRAKTSDIEHLTSRSDYSPRFQKTRYNTEITTNIKSG
ncbi:hypothetical protein AGABI2DRAFT_119828 [Agaricus bisporus var. bisporus H97]|uniref:hypothetical protein n=1 Tax=Agaricus bisporus var. bisporus (strain H97 / ATCC MYA-4626 / FGSC 10389) TaxID=936046 RepID=UPI00029F6C76|nr:hypothetical protein AGABI2DRAFT_119828 [Agaricus bisporus var. bisporus H97]EKV46185.1 hypothetical protein AGABI2DRAFT_119828 [Agaricus bisporus var. bisporus H97]